MRRAEAPSNQEHLDGPVKIGPAFKGQHRVLISHPALEVFTCIAFKQPISQAEIDWLFDADRRGIIVKLRDLKLVKEVAGADGRCALRRGSVLAALRTGELGRLFQIR
jgi:hypothetical protein